MNTCSRIVVRDKSSYVPYLRVESGLGLSIYTRLQRCSALLKLHRATVARRVLKVIRYYIQWCIPPPYGPLSLTSAQSNQKLRPPTYHNHRSPEKEKCLLMKSIQANKEILFIICRMEYAYVTCTSIYNMYSDIFWQVYIVFSSLLQQTQHIYSKLHVNVLYVN